MKNLTGVEVEFDKFYKFSGIRKKFEIFDYFLIFQFLKSEPFNVPYISSHKIMYLIIFQIFQDFIKNQTRLHKI